MANQQPIIIKQNTFVGGVQDYMPYHLVRDISAVRLENCEIHTHGTVRRRGGLRSWYQHATSSDLEPFLLKSFSGIRGLGPLTVAAYRTGTSFNVTIDQGGSSQQSYTMSGSFSFGPEGDIFKLLDRVYFGFPGQECLYWEQGAGNLQQELAVPGFPGTTIPPVVTGLFFQGRGWAGGDPAAADLVYFSNALGSTGDEEASRAPLTWNREFQAFRMETGNVEAILPFRNIALVVFTDHGIEVMEPNCCEILETHRYTLHRTTGCPFPQTIQICGEDLFFMDQEGHLRSLGQTDLDESRGVLNAPTSITIKNIIDRQTKTHLHLCRSAFSKGIYWICMPMDGRQVADQWWGWSIRDQAWIGPYFYGRDVDDDILFGFTCGGATAHRFDGDEDRLYVLGVNHDDELHSYIALETQDLTDDGVMIPVTIETKSYSPRDEVHKTWFHTEQEMRFLHSPQDQSISLAVEVRADEGQYHEIDQITLSALSPDEGDIFTETAMTNSGEQISAYLRENLKTSLTSTAPRGYGLQEKILIRDDQTLWELLTMQVSGFIDPESFAGLP